MSQNGKELFKTVAKTGKKLGLDKIKGWNCWLAKFGNVVNPLTIRIVEDDIHSAWLKDIEKRYGNADN